MRRTNRERVVLAGLRLWRDSCCGGTMDDAGHSMAWLSFVDSVHSATGGLARDACRSM